MPARRMDATGAANAAPAPAANGSIAGMSSILVVDDEAIVREVVVSYLRREGYQTLEAGDGNAARELIEQQQPALVILDVMLPGTDGFELCRWVRARSDLPVILLTARGDSWRQSLAMRRT
jgi:DNA-binding response OmpR family regulator